MRHSLTDKIVRKGGLCALQWSHSHPPGHTPGTHHSATKTTHDSDQTPRRRLRRLRGGRRKEEDSDDETALQKHVNVLQFNPLCVLELTSRRGRIRLKGYVLTLWGLLDNSD